MIANSTRRLVTASNENATQRFLRVATAKGCPPDQIRNFLRAGYVPQPKQLEFHALARACDLPGGPDEIGLGGARGPGKSHALLAQMALDDCQRQQGLKALFLRRIGKQARESFEDLRLRVLPNVPHEYAGSRGTLTFPNGSRIVLGHFKDERDVDAYLGLEYDLIVIEETTTLSRTKYQALRDSTRTSKPEWRPRSYNSTNPGGIGHAWYKQRFVDGGGERSRFVFATVDDNRFVDADYRSKLEENTGWRLRAYRYGDWDIAAGQFFTTFSEAHHVIAPFEISTEWRVWCALDYGFTHWTMVYLLAQDGDGRIYVVDEHAERRWLVPQHAEGIKAMLGRWGLSVGHLAAFVAGPDVFAQRGTPKTIAEEYRQHGISLTPAKTDRINGAARVLALLGDPEQEREPGMMIFRQCRRLVETLPMMQHDPRRPEDVLKVDCDTDTGEGGDDAYDALRYGVMEQAQRAAARRNPFY